MENAPKNEVVKSEYDPSEKHEKPHLNYSVSIRDHFFNSTIFSENKDSVLLNHRHGLIVNLIRRLDPSSLSMSSKKSLSRFLNIKYTPDSSDKDIESTIKNKTDQELIELIEEYSLLFESLRKKYKEDIVPEVFEDMLDVFEKAINKKYLPINQDFFEKEVKNLRIFLNGGFINDAEGSYDINARDISVKVNVFDDSIDKEKLLEVLIHELIHKMSGIEYSIDDVKLKECADELELSTEELLNIDKDLDFLNEEYLEITKHGLRSGNSFKWLDEGVTQLITSNLLSYSNKNNTPDTYHAEQRLVAIISNLSGIEEKDLIKVYFENGNTEKKDDLVEWKKIQDEMNKGLEKRGLNLFELDQMINKKGINKVLDMLYRIIDK